MNLIQNVLAAASAAEPKEQFTTLPLEDILPDPENFYGLREIEELAASIDAFGLDQPLVVRPADDAPGKYKLTGGHRRHAALLMLAEKDPARWRAVSVKLTTSLGALADRARLISLNKTARKETDYEQMCEVVEMAEIARQWKAAGGAIQGKLREAVAQSVGLSSAQVGKYEAIYRHLSPRLMESYKAGLIGTPTAYELSSLPRRQQEEIAAAHPAPTLDEAKAAKYAAKPRPRTDASTTPASPAQTDPAEHQPDTPAGTTPGEENRAPATAPAAQPTPAENVNPPRRAEQSAEPEEHSAARPAPNTPAGGKIEKVFGGSWDGTATGYWDGVLVYDVWHCADCGHEIETDDPDELPMFCPACGRAMTSEALAIVKKRLESMKHERL